VALRSIQCQRGHQRRFTICQALAFLQGRISQGWDKSNCPCNCGIGIVVKRSLPRSPKLHTKRQRQQSILHFLDVLASGNSYRAMRPHGTDACGLCLKSVHQFGFRCARFDASASNVWPGIVSCLSLLKASPPVGTVVASAMNGWNYRAARVDEVLRSDGRLGTCVAIVQCAVSVEASSSTVASRAQPPRWSWCRPTRSAPACASSRGRTPRACARLERSRGLSFSLGGVHGEAKIRGHG
jgi:hypothetical protein